MSVAHIYIYGEIIHVQDEQASKYGYINYKDVVNQMQAQKQNAKSIDVHIHSDGGDIDTGWAIHDFIKAQGLPVRTINEGSAHSIASVVFLAGDPDKREVMPNASSLIHLASGGVMGNSEDVKNYAERLERASNKIAKFYESATNNTSEEIAQWMKDEKEFTADELVEKGFASKKIESLRAVAKFNSNENNNQNIMTGKQAEELKESMNGFQKLMNKVMTAIKGDEKPKALVVQDSNGTEIDFYELGEEDTPSVGDKANVDGSPASGDYVMSDGNTYSFTDGELAEIKEAEKEEEESEEMQNLKSENEKLQEEIKNLKAANEKTEEENKTFAKLAKETETKFKAMQSAFKNAGLNLEKPEGKKEETDKPKVRQLFKQD